MRELAGSRESKGNTRGTGAQTRRKGAQLNTYSTKLFATQIIISVNENNLEAWKCEGKGCIQER